MLVDGYGGGAWKIDVGRGRGVLSVPTLDPLVLRDARVDEGGRLLWFASPEAGAREVRIEPS